MFIEILFYSDFFACNTALTPVTMAWLAWNLALTVPLKVFVLFASLDVASFAIMRCTSVEAAHLYTSILDLTHSYCKLVVGSCSLISCVIFMTFDCVAWRWRSCCTLKTEDTKCIYFLYPPLICGSKYYDFLQLNIISQFTRNCSVYKFSPNSFFR